MSLLASGVLANPSTAYFTSGTTPTPPTPTPTTLSCQVYTASLGGAADLTVLPVGGLQVFAATFASGPTDFTFSYTGTPANKSYWLIQSNCTNLVTIKSVIGGVFTTLGNIKAATPGEPQQGIITYQSGTWYFY